MQINGLQKMTLLDYPGKVACTVFLAGCDMKCPFCHNSELISGTAPAVMDDDGLLEFLKTRRGILEGVAFTGGEPLLRRNLPELIKKVRDLGYPVKLDTNGTHPEQLKYLIEEKLIDYAAMDVKNSPERYTETCGIPDFDIRPVVESIGILLDSARTDGFTFEFRTTVVDELHDADSFSEIGSMIKGAPAYYLQPFVDRDSVLFAGFHAPDADKMRTYRDLSAQYVDKCELRGIE